MKKLLLSIFALCAVVMSASAAKIYVNAGHGSWTSECRNMLLINYPSYGDTLGFWESNTNLWKSLYLEKKLKASGHTVKMSRYYSGGTGQLESSPYDKALHVIAAEANSWGPNYFISVHSNAHQDGAVTNYPLFIHRGYTASETCSGSIWGERILWTHHYEIFNCGQENNSYPNYNNNNKNIQGGLSMNGWDYGVLRHSYPGTLVEGYFHTYQPARHRAMQPDWCRQEGLRYWRGFTEMYGSAKDTKGYVMGYIRTKDKQINQTNYTGRSANDIYYPMNGARVVLRNASGALIKTDPYKYVARDFVSQAIYTTDNYYNGVFVYDDLAPGKYKVYVHCKGYKDLVHEFTITADKTTYLQLFVTAGTGTEPNTAPTLDPDVKWVLNGGIVPGGKVPTNAELWSDFKGYYSTWYNETRADQEIGAVSTFMTKGCDLMTNAKSEYKWLGDYIMAVSAEQGITLTNDPTADGMEASWRWAVHNFFNCATFRDAWPKAADFSTAGKPAAWGDKYRVAKGISAELPYTITSTYTIPTPVREGYDFLGWYNTNNTSGTKYTQLTAGFKGTLYAIWQETPKGDVIWVLNGGAVSGTTLPNYIENNAYTLPTPTKSGYVFLGWYDNANGTGNKLTSLPVGYKGSVYAIWREAKVTWELNGGEMQKAAEVPTNDSLWNAFKVYYKTYYNENRADQPIDMVSTFMTKACEIMTKADSEWKWLGDYIYKVSTDQGVHLSIDPTGDGVEALWRWTVHAFFNCNKHDSWPITADYTSAGKNTAWGPNYQAKYGKGVTLPTKITSAYTIPTPTKTGSTFVGWYDTNNDTGNKLTTLPVGYDGTVYAVWSDMLGDVTWVLNGGKVDMTLPNSITATFTIPVPTKDGYVFVGWYDNEAGTGTAITKLNAGHKGTLYAIWREAKVTWVLNGGKVVKEVTTTTPGKEVAVPTQEELWASFKTAAGLTTLGTLAEIKETAGTNPHNDANAPCACRVICAKLTADMVQAAFGKAEWKWLQTYIAGVQTALAETALTEAAWRYAIAAFFVQSEHNVWPATANFAEAGKPEKWGAAYQQANGATEGETKTEYVEVELPSKITAAYELPTPVKDGDEFVGWYDTNNNTGNKLTVLPVGYDGTVYAIWKSMTATTDIENVRPALDINAPMYDIMGRRVDATYRGIIIQNGNKYLLR